MNKDLSENESENLESKYAISLDASIKDAIYFSIMFGFAEVYFGTFAVFLGLSNTQIGLISSLPLLLGALSQLVAVRYVEKGSSRKDFLSKVAIYQALCLFPLALLSQIALSQALTAFVFITLICLYFIFGHMAMPVWVSLLGDLVDPKIKGRYFGKRNKKSGIVLLISIVITGLFLHYAKLNGSTATAFLIAFIIAAIARLISSYYISQHQDILFVKNEEDHFSFFDFIKKIPKSNFATFTLFFSLMHFALFMAGPYFIVYMLNDLKLSYLELTFLTTVSLGTQSIMMQFWGGIGDRYGNKFIFNVSSFGLCMSPILWIFNQQLWYLALANCFGGFFWAGFNLAAGNFLLDAVKPAKRGRCNAYLWIINAFCIVLGSYVGSQFLYISDKFYFLEAMSLYLGSPFLLLFLCSGILRGIILIIFLPRFKEVREVEKFSSQKIVYRISRVQAFAGVGFSYTSGIFRNKNRNFKKEFIDD